MRKGEHGTRVCFVKQLQVRSEKVEHEDAVRLVPKLREYTVFNVDQCENLPEAVYATPPARMRNPDSRDQLADDFLCSTGADIREGHGETYYVPSRDFISIPAFGAFKGADQFYNVAFHELTRWTGRLKHRFGSRDYAAEELVAELGAAFLCAEFGFDGNVRNVGYICSWTDLLKADKRAFFTAASKACWGRVQLPRKLLCVINNLGEALAEREGFEPSIRFPVYTLSKRAPSATRPPLQNRGGCCGCPRGFSLSQTAPNPRVGHGGVADVLQAPPALSRRHAPICIDLYGLRLFSFLESGT